MFGVCVVLCAFFIILYARPSVYARKYDESEAFTSLPPYPSGCGPHKRTLRKSNENDKICKIVNQTHIHTHVRRQPVYVNGKTSEYRMCSRTDTIATVYGCSHSAAPTEAQLTRLKHRRCLFCIFFLVIVYRARLPLYEYINTNFSLLFSSSCSGLYA